MVATLGQKWSAIGRQLGRFPTDCRDKYRLVKSANFNQGPWSPNEDSRLLELVMTTSKDGQPPKSGILWTAISQQLGTRSHSQCRLRYFSKLYYKAVMSAGGNAAEAAAVVAANTEGVQPSQVEINPEASQNGAAQTPAAPVAPVVPTPTPAPTAAPADAWTADDDRELLKK